MKTPERLLLAVVGALLGGSCAVLPAILSQRSSIDRWSGRSLVSRQRGHHWPERVGRLPDRQSDSAPSPLPLPHTMTSEAYQALLYRFLAEREYVIPGWAQDKYVRDTGPFIDGKSYGTHDAVRVWYSPEVIAWLEGGREDCIPDGAMIIKEMFDSPAARYDGLHAAAIDSAVRSWTVMVRDSSGSKDGWYWSFYMPGQPIDDPASYPYDYPNSGFGQYCVRCHASAESEFTFSSLANIEGYPGDPLTFRVDDSWLPGRADRVEGQTAHRALAAAAVPGETKRERSKTPNTDFAALFDQIPVSGANEVERIPPVGYDHVWSGPGGPEQFVTSDQCLSCHDALAPPFGPNMYIASSDGKNVNLSPYGEWNWSMMALAGRNPVFYAQLESEIRSYPRALSDSIQNLCFSCHGAMGQRQLAIDHPGRLFNERIPYITSYDDSLYEYGALARDGVSCTVCHQIVDDRMPLDSIVTGRFRVSHPGEREEGVSYIYGPFDDPRVLAMKSSLGMKPVQSEYIKSSRLCGSCHSVKLPVYDRNGKQVGEAVEQATYPEWQNSAYQDEYTPVGATPKTCQDCHMPTSYPYPPDDSGRGGDPQELAFRIANIQDQTYPAAAFRAPFDSIDVSIRSDFARHSLLGINIFALEMFNQFDDILGVRKQDYMTRAKNGLPFAIATAGRLAGRHTARAYIENVERTDSGLRARVKVTNLTGHRLPSGVGFRRVFLEVAVADAADTVVWASGQTNALGVIVDGRGRPLRSEFREADPRADTQLYQRHHRIITRQDQVQIYQELAKNTDGAFTTSLVGIAERIKDNRLLPIGWTPEGPPGFRYAEWTMPQGNALADPDFLDGSGSDVILYDIRLPSSAIRDATLTATLYYQSIPPNYLRDRFSAAPDGAGTRRLHYLAAHLRTAGTLIENWKLRVAQDRRRIE